MIRKITEDLKKLMITYDDNSYIFVPVLLLALIGAALYWATGIQITLLTIIPLALFFVLAMQFHIYRKTEADLEEERRQQQALAAIHSLINIRSPLPPMTGWSAQPELATTIMEYIHLLEPSFILEAGSGASSVVSCYCLEKMQGGRLLSLDHDESYGAKTKEQLRRHGVDSFGEVVFAPLKEYDLEGKKWQWYDLEAYNGSSIDILVVDGPPVKTQPMARYPALPLLYEHLSERAVVILDDAARESESKIVERWREKYPEFTLDYRNTQKGIAVLSRNV